MAGITLAQAEARLAEYLTAEQRALSNQSYEIAGRKLTRAQLAEIREGIQYWNDQVKELNASSSGRGRRSITLVPR